MLYPYLYPKFFKLVYRTLVPVSVSYPCPYLGIIVFFFLIELSNFFFLKSLWDVCRCSCISLILYRDTLMNCQLEILPQVFLGVFQLCP